MRRVLHVVFHLGLIVAASAVVVGDASAYDVILDSTFCRDLDRDSQPLFHLDPEHSLNNYTSARTIDCPVPNHGIASGGGTDIDVQVRVCDGSSTAAVTCTAWIIARGTPTNLASDSDNTASGVGEAQLAMLAESSSTDTIHHVSCILPALDTSEPYVCGLDGFSSVLHIYLEEIY